MENKITLECERDVAYDSLDHKMPWGTRRDNSKNSRFNKRLFDLFTENEYTYDKEKKANTSTLRIVSVLDLGCSGGGFVKTVIDEGHLAVGLEGSDYSKRMKRAEWAVIPEFLFTCDVTGDFKLSLDGKPMKFDAVTSWEVMEHIPEKGLPKMIENVKSHLNEGGIWIMSVANWHDVVNGVDLHQSVHEKSWWINLMKEHGLEYLPEHVKYFNTQFVRGKYETEKDFHLIVTNNKDKAPKIPKKGFKSRIGWNAMDHWVGSKPQKVLRMITGRND